MSISMALKHHDLVLKIGFVYEKGIFIHRRRNSSEVVPAQFQQYYQNNIQPEKLPFHTKTGESLQCLRKEVI